MALVDVKDEADTIYSTIISGLKSETPEKFKSKMNFIVEMLGNIIPKKTPIEEVKFKLRELKDNEPKEFIEVANDPNIKLKIFIKRGLRAGEIIETGGVYYIQDERIGNYQTTLEYIKEPTNGVIISKLKDAIDKIDSMH